MTVLDEIKQFEPDLVAIRRDIHAHPETRFEEHRTAALVAAKLREWGIEVTEGVGRTGVVGTLRGARPGQRAIGLRADMDALFIHEENTFPHASTMPGKMHACGHDGHTTMLLGAARYLARNPTFAGTVQFIFQPAEEAATGAPAMIADGLFDRFPVESVWGLHNSPGIAVGRFAMRPGPTLAGADFWAVTFHGTGGHGGAAPHLATDVTVALGQFLLAVHTIKARNLHPTEGAALSVGHVHGGAFESPNVMPAKVIVRGTARYFTPEAQAIMRRRLGELATALAEANGCTADFEYTPLMPAHREPRRKDARSPRRRRSDRRRRKRRRNPAQHRWRRLRVHAAATPRRVRPHRQRHGARRLVPQRPHAQVRLQRRCPRPRRRILGQPGASGAWHRRQRLNLTREAPPLPHPPAGATSATMPPGASRSGIVGLRISVGPASLVRRRRLRAIRPDAELVQAPKAALPTPIGRRHSAIQGRIDGRALGAAGAQGKSEHDSCSDGADHCISFLLYRPNASPPRQFRPR